VNIIVFMSYTVDPWAIIEDGFNPQENRVSESIFSLGNGSMGQRANFEESYSGDSLQGSYIGGVYYPDKTRVGWWKNGYPEYFAKVLNSVNWIGIEVKVNRELLDLNKWKVISFKRTLDMERGLLNRVFIAISPKGDKIKVEAIRFLSMVRKDIGSLTYSITPLTNSCNIEISSFLDGNVTNEDSNYSENFWQIQSSEIIDDNLSIISKTKKSNFTIHALLKNQFNIIPISKNIIVDNGFISEVSTFNVDVNQGLTLNKTVSINSTFTTPKESLKSTSLSNLNRAIGDGWDTLLSEHSDFWKDVWEISDIEIVGEDNRAQQGIRYNIFQLNQTYTGENSKLNIGPKGFTGEKYGGTTYWDTEAYCLPFYLGTKDQDVGKQLLKYRYNQLDKAIENSMKLGIGGGAALYPMVTINGEECHNEWEITFEEIHRNGAIAYGIFNYINITGDDSYLFEGGLEVLIAISRYWIRRVSFSYDKKMYVILGVTGPNEYENNVNNNWYTNRVAIWTLEYTYTLLNKLIDRDDKQIGDIIEKVKLTTEELDKFIDIAHKIYLPQKEGIFLQQDGFLDKEIVPVSDIPKEERPINQTWSWDRILRSCYIKQADVLQGIYFFEDSFTLKEIKDNFDFYEPLTLHESSLSPCIHSIIASKLGYRDKAYQLYLRTARLDLDNINNDTDDGCHITSMAGSWMSIIYGFGGIRFTNSVISINPQLPNMWNSLKFKLKFQGRVISFNISHSTIVLNSDRAIEVLIKGNNYSLSDKTITIPI
jgi:maltose phosphorylase